MYLDLCIIRLLNRGGCMRHGVESGPRYVPVISGKRVPLLFIDPRYDPNRV